MIVILAKNILYLYVTRILYQPFCQSLAICLVLTVRCLLLFCQTIVWCLSDDSCFEGISHVRLCGILQTVNSRQILGVWQKQHEQRCKISQGIYVIAWKSVSCTRMKMPFFGKFFNFLFPFN